ncbi:MAG: 4-hydroxy-tetrahydrodipicolinate synthase [Allosphingosinicella sp.]
MFKGSFPALVTPFRDEAFDEGAFRAFVDWQISEGSHGLVPCGTTGEAATLSFEEHWRVVELCVEQAAGRVPVIAGCGSNDTRSAKENMKAALDRGATAALCVVPYYNRPNQEGMYAHFAALAAASPLPIVIYNVPSRSVADISVETLGRLAELPTIVGIKDATGNLGRVSAQRLACGEDFEQLSGNDDMALGFNAMGGIGCISVSANVAPKLCADFQNACLAGDWATALTLQDRLYPLHAALFTDASPGPVKYGVNRVRPDFPSELRLPMTPPGAASRRAVDEALVHAGLI